MENQKHKCKELDTEGISIYNRKNLLEISIYDIAKYHGGMCPGIAVGFKAIKLAIKLLWEGEIPQRDDFLIIVTNDLPKCAGDALEFVTRAKTKGNLVVNPGGNGRIDWTFVFARKSKKKQSG